MEHLIKYIATHFKTEIDALAVAPIQHGTRQRHNVCRLRFGGKDYILKQHDITAPVVAAGWTPLQIEATVLGLLYDKGCRVPELLWKSERHHALLLESCGESTLDALAQHRDESAQNLTPLLFTILHEVCKIETCFATHGAQLASYVFRFNAQAILQDLLSRGKKVVGYISHLRNRPMSSIEEGTFAEAWEVLTNRLQDAPRTLGSLDNNARNIVIREESVFFIDFASIGWHWQEMRLVQLFNSIGAFLVSPSETGNFISLLDRELVKTYAEWVSTHRETCPANELTARVDGHHLLFYLSVVDQLLKAVARPDSPENRMLFKAWGDPEERFRSAMAHITDTHLSDDVYTNRIREIITDLSS